MKVFVINLFFVVITFFGLSPYCAAADANEDVDEKLAESLKIEANHNLNRIKSYKSESSDNKIFANEREKGLGEFFEEQEKWDLIRERGLQEYLKQKHVKTSLEGSPEHQQYLKDNAKLTNQYEKGRKIYVSTRNKIRIQQNQTIAQLEHEELQLNAQRPRYELQKRSRNKWIAGAGSKPGSGSSSGSSQQTNYPSPANDFPSNPPRDEGFEDLPPAPVYDSVPYDPSFSGDMPMPPPAPPPPDYDF